MQKHGILVVTCLAFGLAALPLRAQIPTWEERVRDSGFNPEYRNNWRSGYLQLPQTSDPEKDEPNLIACFRGEFELPAAPRRAEITLSIPGRDLRYPYRFTVNGHEMDGPRWGEFQLGGLRNLDITEHLRPGRNVLTFSNEARSSAGRPPRGSNWLLAEGIVFCEDGSTLRILSDGWHGGWNLPKGWDDATVDVTTIEGMQELKSGRGGQVSGPVEAMGTGLLYMRPYYGPIQVQPVSSSRGAMEQPIFDEEDPAVLDVTLLNMQAAAEATELVVEIMDEMTRADLGTHKLEPAPDGALDLAARLDLGRLGLGTYRCRFILREDGEETDRRDYEIAVVGEIPQRLVEGTHYEDGLDLRKVWSVDCTEEPDDEKFIAAHIRFDGTPETSAETRVVEGPAGRYRELESAANMLYFAYQYRLQNVYTPHLAIVEWPDDAERNFIVHVTEASTFAARRRGGYESRGHQRSEASVNMRTDQQPVRSGRMQKLHLLFWPNAERGSVHITNIGGGAGAAAARITIYEITNDLPALRIADAGDRLIGPHSERGPQTMSASYYAGPMGNHFSLSLGATGHPEFYRNWMTTAENFIKRMRFEGQNLYLMGHLMYEGTLYPSQMRKYGYRQDQYFGGDAVLDYVTLLLRMFERNGIYMISGIEHRFVSAFARAWGVNQIPSPEEIKAGAEHTQLVRRDGTYGSSPNYFHPYIQEGIIAMVGELADLYGTSPAWRGITFILGCSHGGFGPIDMADRGISSLDEMLTHGYEDLSVALFEEQTGIKIPVSAVAADRYEQRYQWIMANAREEWIQWRCDQYTDLWRRIRDRLTAVNPELELQLNMGEPLLVGHGRLNILDGHYDDPGYMLRFMRKIGFDVEALRQEDNIRITKTYMASGGGGALTGHHGWRELNRNEGMQSVFADDGRGGVYMYSGIPHYGAFTYPWDGSRGIDCDDRGPWLWDFVAVRQGYFYSTHVIDSFAHVMARSNPTVITHTWMDVKESMGRIHEKRLFARAYRSLPNGKYRRLTGNGLDKNLWISSTVKDGAEYAYAANLHWWELDVTLDFAPGSRVHDLITDKPVELRDNAWSFELGPYRIQTFRIERGGLLRRMFSGAERSVLSAAAEGNPGDRALLEQQLNTELNRAATAVNEARSRREEFETWPAWDQVDILDRRLRDARTRLAEGDLAGVYGTTVGGEFLMIRESVVSDLLEAMPMLVLGPFGKPEDTVGAGARRGNVEVVTEFQGMETPFLDEFADADGERLREGFAPDIEAKYETYTDDEARWRMTLNTGSFGFAPYAHSESPLWMSSYAYTEVYSPESREAVLRAGSDHAMWVWLNDERVIRHGGHGTHRGGQRPGGADQNRATVKLREGWNRVFVKAVQRGPAQCYLRLTDADGNALTELRYRIPGNA